MADDLTPERLAELFHATYERLAPSFGYQTRPASATAWANVPEPNKSLMIAVAAEVIAAVRAENAVFVAQAAKWNAEADRYLAQRDELTVRVAELEREIAAIRAENEDAEDRAHSLFPPLLRGVCDALKGVPDPSELKWHDWSDLPDVARRWRERAEAAEAELARLKTS